MNGASAKQPVLAGLFVAIGLLLPPMFHVAGMGSAFLPMHLPVLLAGFFLAPPYATAVGAIIPFLSGILMGMPPVFPVMPFMVVELATYGAVVSLLYQRWHLNVYLSLIGSMVAGRVMASVAVWVLATFFAAKLPGPVAFASAAVVASLPGIVIQLLFIPALVLVLARRMQGAGG